MLRLNGLTRRDRDTEYLVGNLQERYASVGRGENSQSVNTFAAAPTDWPALCAINQGIRP